jgi:uncharacterized protein YkwD
MRARLEADRTTARRPVLAIAAALLLAGILASPAAHAALPFGCPATLETEIATLINKERTSRGLQALQVDIRLVQAARLHSQDMASHNFFSHTGTGGSYFANRIGAAGYAWTAAGEDIAAGYTTAATVVAGWMASQGHRDIILSTSYRHVGVGYAYSASATYRHYYTADFGNTSSALQSPAQLCVVGPACSDGIDNDGDGKTDYPQDLECASANDAYETNDCADGIDNDGDGKIDFGAGPNNDPGCPMPLGRFTENPACNDGIDNDGDLRVDLADSQCAGAAWVNSESSTDMACGLGFEVAPLLPLLAWLRRRRQWAAIRRRD